MGFLFPDQQHKCVFSPDRVYRYRLSRIWDPLKDKILFLMLNPSTADEQVDDPTIKRCIAFAKAWGFGGLEVCNIFALRSTDPKLLYTHAAPVGEDNDRHIHDAVQECAKIVCAWGEHGLLYNRGGIVSVVLKMFSVKGKVICLKKNKSGMPVHPLYQPANTVPVEF